MSAKHAILSRKVAGGHRHGAPPLTRIVSLRDILCQFWKVVAAVAGDVAPLYTVPPYLTLGYSWWTSRGANDGGLQLHGVL